MSACSVDVIKRVGRYLNVPTGTTCLNTDKVLTTVLDKQDIEGFASIVLTLALKSGLKMGEEQRLLSYQWLEHFAKYADQAAQNPSFAKKFLQDINRSLERNSYLTGQFFTITDVAAYQVLYSLIDRLSIVERESFIHVCRWFRHVQSLPRATSGLTPLPLDAIFLTISSPVVH